MNTVEKNDAVNLDSSSVIELGRTAVNQSSTPPYEESSAPEFPGQSTRSSTQARELLSGPFDVETPETHDDEG